MEPDPLEAIRALTRRHGAILSVQIREKDLPARTLYEWIQTLLPDLCGATLFVNDRVDVARCFETVGVHLPEEGLSIAAARSILGPERPIGASVHRAEDAWTRRTEGADLVTLSPIFESPGKGPPLGLEPLKEAASAGGVYALGGVTRARMPAIEATGAAGVAAIRAFWRGDI